MRRFPTLALLLSLILCGCGQSGTLYLPPEQTKDSATASESATPAEQDAPEDEPEDDKPRSRPSNS